MFVEKTARKFIQTHSPSINQKKAENLSRLGGASGVMRFLGFGPCTKCGKIGRTRPQETKTKNAQMLMIIVLFGAIVADMYVTELAHRTQWVSIVILETKTVILHLEEVVPGHGFSPEIITFLEDKFAIIHYLLPGWTLKTAIGMDLNAWKVDPSL